MPKHNVKKIVSKRQMFRRVASEVQHIYNEINTCRSNSLDQASPENDLCNLKNNIDTEEEFIVLDSYASVEENFLNTSDTEIFQELDLCSGASETEQSTKNVKKDLALKLRHWATSEKITHSALKSLLHILSPYHPELPLDSRTLLCTPQSFKIKKLDKGNYIHLGLERALRLFFQKTENFSDDIITVSFNIDGIPLYNSSKVQAWPILGLIKNFDTQQPFAVGVFCGESKPTPLGLYFEEFITECNILKEGFLFDGKKYLINIHSFICDAPAKAFIKCIKYPGGYSCCDKCVEFGTYVNGRVVLTDLSAAKRTDVSFRAQIDEDHHVGTSPLLQLNIDMINHFPIDYMHNVCLGVMRKLLISWTGGSLNVRLPGRLTNLLSDKLISLKEYVPSEINRKPRSLSELPRFKATEFRTFLLYTGIVVLKDIIDERIYNHFLLLHSGIATLMFHDSISKEMNCELASKVLVTFVEHSKRLYGSEFIIYNVHVLSHLSEDVLRYGLLDTFAAFPFENFLGQLKGLVKSPTKPLQQICRRICELDYASLINNDNGAINQVKFGIEHSNGPCIRNGFQKQYKKIYLSTYFLSIHSYLAADSYCFTENCIIQIENIVTDNVQQDLAIIGRHFTNSCSFYEYPFDSRLLGIHVVWNLSADIRMWSFQTIKGKCLVFPYKENWVSIPLFHTLNEHNSVCHG